MNGEPLEGAIVVFAPQTPKVTGSKSVSGTALPAADYRKHLAEHRKRMCDRLLYAGSEEDKAFSVQLVPHQYTSVGTTPLSAEVGSGQANEFTFAID